MPAPGEKRKQGQEDGSAQKRAFMPPLGYMPMGYMPQQPFPPGGAMYPGAMQPPPQGMSLRPLFPTA